LQVAGEVLSVVSQQSVEEAQKDATRNNITNCHYFNGRPEEALLQIVKKIRFEKACVVICGATHSPNSK
jgi:tRNA/tmRNA/rRNA uracil-C5-methylase (TrmA/RlmC/RlmD family)